MPKHACQEYRKVFAMLEEDGIFEANKIPQLEDMSAFLKSKSLTIDWLIESCLFFDRSKKILI